VGTDRLSDKEKEVLYATWLETRSIRDTAKRCKLNPHTVRRYKKKYNWEKRSRKVDNVVARKIERVVERRRARQLKQYQLMQMKGVQALQLKDPAEIKVSDAITAIDVGVKGEREITGDGADEITITVKWPKGLEL